MKTLRNKNRAVFAGTFDPFTKGHLDIALRAASLYDELIIAVGNNTQKTTLFSLQERLKIVQKSIDSDSTNIKVQSFEGLLTDFCAQVDAGVILRGIRTVSDMEYERSLSTVYKKLDSLVEIVCLINSQELGHIHGFLVRDLLKNNADISDMVGDNAKEYIYTIYKSKVK